MSAVSKGLKNPTKDSYFILGVNKLIKSNFKDSHLFMVVPNLKKYRVSEDPYIFGQKMGKIPEVAEIYVSSNYLCDVSENMKPDEVLGLIQYKLIEKLKVKNSNGSLHTSTK